MKKLLTLLLILFLIGCGGQESPPAPSSLKPTPPAPVDISPSPAPSPIASPTQVPPPPPYDPTMPPKKTYIVSGGANASGCDWSYVESEANVNIIMLAKGDVTIKQLYDAYDISEVLDSRADGMIFIHGEVDGETGTPAVYYNKKLENYRKMVSKDAGEEVPLLISTVGYYAYGLDHYYDALRGGVKHEAMNNDNWIVAFDNSHSFRERNMLSDAVHFGTEACKEMMDAVMVWV